MLIQRPMQIIYRSLKKEMSIKKRINHPGSISLEDFVLDGTVEVRISRYFDLVTISTSSYP